MQHDFEHGLRVQLATALLERDDFEALNRRSLERLYEAQEALAAARLAAEEAAAGTDSMRTDRDYWMRQAAAARRECEGLKEVLDATEAARIVGLADERREKARADAAVADLRAAVSKALDLAAQEILIAFDDACWDGLADRVRVGKWTALATPASAAGEGSK